jgi:hypothetical protein
VRRQGWIYLGTNREYHEKHGEAVPEQRVLERARCRFIEPVENLFLELIIRNWVIPIEEKKKVGLASLRAVHHGKSRATESEKWDAHPCCIRVVRVPECGGLVRGWKVKVEGLEILPCGLEVRAGKEGGGEGAGDGEDLRCEDLAYGRETVVEIESIRFFVLIKYQ